MGTSLSLVAVSIAKMRELGRTMTDDEASEIEGYARFGAELDAYYRRRRARANRQR
jgi:hypothetical protein